MSTETIHVICSPCYGTMPNLREPIPLVMPHCYRHICCYCKQNRAYEGIFYRDTPRQDCQCKDVAASIATISRQHSEMIRAGASPHDGGLFVLLEDDRGRGAHLHPIGSLSPEDRVRWLKNVEAQGHHRYTGYPNQEP